VVWGRLLINAFYTSYKPSLDEQQVHILSFAIILCQLSMTFLALHRHRDPQFEDHQPKGQGFPVRHLSGKNPSGLGNICLHLSYALVIWEIWPIFAVHEPKPRASCSTRTKIEQKHQTLHEISQFHCTFEISFVSCINTGQYLSSGLKRSEWA
jgi:hypothetical protein